VRGHCWGCGLEFVLNCRYRLAANTHSTDFFMTEVVSYLLFPTFEGAHQLPLQLGLENAINLLLWGERWDVQRARREALVNDVADYRYFAESVDDFVARVLAGSVSPCTALDRRHRWSDRAARPYEAARERVARLPPAYQEVYRDCLDQMARAVQKDVLGEEDHALAQAREARSILAPAGKAAQRFYFIRQVAENLTGREAAAAAGRRLAFVGRGPDFAAFARQLGTRVIEGVGVAPLTPPGATGASSRLEVNPAGAGGPGSPLATEIDVHLRPGLYVPAAGRWTLYNPVWPCQPAFCELACPVEHPDDRSDVLAYLRRAGFTVVPTRPRGCFGSDRLLAAFLRPLVAFVTAGGRGRDVDFTLREFGFLRRPHDLLRAVGTEAAADLLGPSGADPADREDRAWESLGRLRDEEFSGGAYRAELIDALTVSLLAAVAAALAEGVFAHPTLVDVTAREVLDFPLLHTSLCTYLSRGRVSAALDRASGFGACVRAEDRTAATDFVRRGQEFYL
jgi:enoyl-CoA hydratase/carnithine racemase